MRPITEDEFRDEFAEYGLDPARYYDAWRLLLVLWYSVWWCSNVDWSQYRRMTIWPRFSNWVTSAARRSSDLQRFLSAFARSAKLTAVGKNAAERHLVLTYFLALPDERQRQIVGQYRDDMPILVAFVREFSVKYRKTDEEDLDDDQA